MTEATTAPDLCQRIDRVRRQIKQAAEAGERDWQDISLLAVSKRHPAAAIEAAARCGQVSFGENYVQEALEKIEQLATLNLDWHFIGPIQSNKTRDISSHFHWVHSVDRLKIATRLNNQRPAENPVLNVCLQVNISGESSKSGVSINELPALADKVSKLTRLRLRGLMAIPAANSDSEQQHQAFRLLADQFHALNANGYHLDTLSMGMSGDLEAAIVEGSTIVRIGTAIFGQRAP